MPRPNVLFITVDQLTATVLPLFGYQGVPTPNLEALGAASTTFDNMISTCPVCTPFRSMWLTGRHPQTTGHVINTMTTRHDEIGWGDVFAHAGYDTGYIGKWHLHKGVFPDRVTSGFVVPTGRDRLGFRWWRGYNLIASYNNGLYNLGDTGRSVPWEGYETEAMPKLAFEFIDNDKDPEKPFCLLINPHQPHIGAAHRPDRMAPDAYYERLPETLPLPTQVDAELCKKHEMDYRHYYAMILSVDDMLGEIVEGLRERGLLESTLLVFTSDHGTHLGMHPVSNTHPFWTKKRPYDSNVKVPLVIRYPAAFEAGRRCDTLTAPVDLLPTFCGLCDIPIPSTVEGLDLSDAWLGRSSETTQEAVLMMNFAYRFSYPADGWEWRGIRTKTHTYARFLTGEACLFDHTRDPFQQTNLIEKEEYAALAAQCEQTMRSLLDQRNDDLHPGSYYVDWFDDERRVIRNACGPLPDPEAEPDWRLLNA